MAANPNFDQLLSTTLYNYRDKLTDNVFTKTPFFYWLTEKKRKRTEDGGVKILEQLLYDDNTLSSYQGYDVLNTAPVEGITSAEFNWKQFQVPITIDRITERKNSGKHKIINLLEAKIKQSEKTMRDGLNYQAIRDDGSGNGSKNLTGLAAMVEADGTYGNINRSTYSWWKAYEENTAAVLSYDYMQTGFLTVADGSDQTDLILTGQTLYQKYWALLQPQQRYTEPKTLDAGFQNLLFNGAVIMLEKEVPAGEMYFLNSDYINFVVDTQTDMITTPFRTPVDQDAKVAHILLYAELTCSNCSKQGKLTAKTAS